MSRLVARGVSVELSGRAILNDVSLSLAAGEVVGLIGPNGAGKSTLMRALVGQLPSSGAIEVDGHALPSLSPERRAQLVAYLPQARIIGWPLAVRSVVALGRMPWSRRGAALAMQSSEVASAMAAMDVAHLADRPATQLSGGEQARVLAARAIAQTTPILVADEPASGLDPAHQISMMMALRAVAAEGRSVLVSLHDLSLAARWCDRLVVLDGGRVAAQGSALDVMTTALLRDVFSIVAQVETTEDGMTLVPLGLA